MSVLRSAGHWQPGLPFSSLSGRRPWACAVLRSGRSHWAFDGALPALVCVIVPLSGNDGRLDSWLLELLGLL